MGGVHGFFGVCWHSCKKAEDRKSLAFFAFG